MPPPSWAGILIAARMASTAAAVDGLAFEGAVQVDDVQVREALLLEGARLGGRIVIEDGRRAHVAELQADALAVLQVDGRK